MKLASAAIMIRPRCLPDSMIVRKISAPEFSHNLDPKPTCQRLSRVHNIGQKIEEFARCEPRPGSPSTAECVTLFRLVRGAIWKISVENSMIRWEISAYGPSSSAGKMSHPGNIGSVSTMKKTLSTVLLLVLLIACSDDKNEKSVSRSEFGDRWPLTVGKGTVKCLSTGEVIFISNGKEYGVNGWAKTRGYQKINIIQANDYEAYNKMAEEIAESENAPLWKVKEDIGPVFGKSIGPILDLGLSLCDK